MNTDKTEKPERKVTKGALNTMRETMIAAHGVEGAEVKTCPVSSHSECQTSCVLFYDEAGGCLLENCLKKAREKLIREDKDKK